jgi:hypothetical protein
VKVLLAVLPCLCKHHPGGKGCGNSYGTFGHYGWGEPWIRKTRCPTCDNCGPSGGAYGIEGLSPEKRGVQKWINGRGADVLLALSESIGLFRKCSYAIKHRLSPRFSKALELRNTGIKKDSECGCDFLFEIEIGTIWHEGSKGLVPRLDGDYNPLELAYVLNPTELQQDILAQGITCPICDQVLHLMLHEGWIKAPSIGYGNKPRPYRVYYLTCYPDYSKYTPNRAIKSNDWMPPFNRLPPVKRYAQWASFWADSLYWAKAFATLPDPDLEYELSDAEQVLVREAWLEDGDSLLRQIKDNIKEISRYG